ncbi:MAG: hypothetical protein CMB16_00485 [Euryarchaeota archaeon]|jgi:hypothetical protein|nr:hypothetical protein [Euryarchaeota archaeon]|tara:strand:+ start:2745 stop:2960 length:216 start_codon:yes stop_codon:yes gene_type:complete
MTKIPKRWLDWLDLLKVEHPPTYQAFMDLKRINAEEFYKMMDDIIKLNDYGIEPTPQKSQKTKDNSQLNLF